MKHVFLDEQTFGHLTIALNDTRDDLGRNLNFDAKRYSAQANGIDYSGIGIGDAIFWTRGVQFNPLREVRDGHVSDTIREALAIHHFNLDNIAGAAD